MQCILVKSGEFENSRPLLYHLFKSWWLCCCSLAPLAPQQKLNISREPYGWDWYVTHENNKSISRYWNWKRTIPTEWLTKLANFAISVFKKLQIHVESFELIQSTRRTGQDEFGYVHFVFWWVKPFFSCGFRISVAFCCAEKKMVLINIWYGPCVHAGIDFQVIRIRIGLRKDCYPIFLWKIVFIWTFVLPFAMQ